MKLISQLYDQLESQRRKSIDFKIFSSYKFQNNKSLSFFSSLRKHSDLTHVKIDKNDFFEILETYRKDKLNPNIDIYIYSATSHTEIYNQKYINLENTLFYPEYGNLIERFERKFSSDSYYFRESSKVTYLSMLEMIRNNCYKVGSNINPKPFNTILEEQVETKYFAHLSHAKKLLFLKKIYACFLKFKLNKCCKEILEITGLTRNQ